jgi:hypothetical protein
MEVAARAVTIGDLHATLCTAIGVNPAKENVSPEGRPIPLVDRAGKVVEEVISKT